MELQVILVFLLLFPHLSAVSIIEGISNITW